MVIPYVTATTMRPAVLTIAMINRKYNRNRNNYAQAYGREEVQRFFNNIIAEGEGQMLL